MLATHFVATGSPDTMADDNMEIYSDHDQNVGDQDDDIDIDIDIDITVDPTDEDHILDDAISEIDYDEDEQLHSAPTNHDDLMVDDYDEGDNRSARMEDALSPAPGGVDTGPETVSHDMDDGAEPISFDDSDKLQDGVDVQEHVGLDNGTDRTWHDNGTEQETDQWVSDARLPQPAFEEGFDIAESAQENDYAAGEEDASETFALQVESENADDNLRDTNDVVSGAMENAELLHVEALRNDETESHQSPLHRDDSAPYSSTHESNHDDGTNEDLHSPNPLLFDNSTADVEVIVDNQTDTHDETNEPIPTAEAGHLSRTYELKVMYQDAQYDLFAASETDHVDSFFIRDAFFALQPIDNLFAEFRRVLGEDISEEELLCIRIEDLGLEFQEDSALNEPEITIAAIVTLYERLQQNDKENKPRPLNVFLDKKINSSKRYANLVFEADQGVGLSEVGIWAENGEFAEMGSSEDFVESNVANVLLLDEPEDKYTNEDPKTIPDASEIEEGNVTLLQSKNQHIEDDTVDLSIGVTETLTEVAAEEGLPIEPTATELQPTKGQYDSTKQSHVDLHGEDLIDYSDDEADNKFPSPPRSVPSNLALDNASGSQTHNENEIPQQSLPSSPGKDETLEKADSSKEPSKTLAEQNETPFEDDEINYEDENAVEYGEEHGDPDEVEEEENDHELQVIEGKGSEELDATFGGAEHGEIDEDDIDSLDAERQVGKQTFSDDTLQLDETYLVLTEESDVDIHKVTIADEHLENGLDFSDNNEKNLDNLDVEPNLKHGHRIDDHKPNDEVETESTESDATLVAQSVPAIDEINYEDDEDDELATVQNTLDPKSGAPGSQKRTWSVASNDDSVQGKEAKRPKPLQP